MNPTMYLTGPQVLARFGISSMSLYRWQAAQKLGFPQPIRIQRRRYFRLDEIEAFEARQATPAGRIAAE